MSHQIQKNKKWSRRDFLTASLGTGALLASGVYAAREIIPWRRRAEVFIAKAGNYDVDLASILTRGLFELGLQPTSVKGKRILLKPNLVESQASLVHICTHPLVVQGAAEAFYRLGAARVLVGEGTGHCRDVYRVLDESGLTEILNRERLPFVDLNQDDIFTTPNLGKFTQLKRLAFPVTLKKVDWVVSLAKLKTHHWAGLTLSMKNLFGVMPGIVYGWPKNVLHHAGIIGSILDINKTLRPDLAIIDGIVGMEGDGPIMGDPKPVGVLVLGRNFPAVDASCARIMGIEPDKVTYLKFASGRLGPIGLGHIDQRGEAIASVRTKFKLLEHIPALKQVMG
jgi:uncharacterized protein (DUF362 family)